MFGMSSRIADQATEAKGAMDIKDPSLGWMIGFLFLVCFVGLFALVPLRKVISSRGTNQGPVCALICASVYTNPI